MLVLTRKINQKIRIGDDIEIAILSVREDGRVRIGINAPPDVPVHRQEVYDLINKDRRDDQS